MLDTGALVALERGRQGMRKVHRVALESGTSVVAITPVLAEWWRQGVREKERLKILRTLVLEPPDAYVARLAGAAVGRVGAGVVEALVMAAASRRGDLVYTSDVHDFERLAELFPTVQLERV